MPLADHVLKVIGTTSLGITDEDQATVTVADTEAPTVEASLVQNGKKNQLEVSITASDICDPNPMFTSVAGAEVMDGQTLKVDKKSGDPNIPSNDLSLTIIATDASGNTTEEQVQLQQ